MPSPRGERALGTVAKVEVRAVERVGIDVGTRWPLPSLTDSTSKLDRGTVLIVGGSTQTPGAVWLAGCAALKAGAGRLQIATTAPSAVAMAVALPEARVIGLETRGVEMDPEAIAGIDREIGAADAVLLGTGGLDPQLATAVAAEVLNRVGPTTRVVLDAAALATVTARPELLEKVLERALLIPNGTEAGHLLGAKPDEIELDPLGAVSRMSRQFGAIIGLRLATTYSAGPDGPIYVDDSGHPGLGTSGSGDVFAGVLLGLLAGDADSLTALIRAVHCHGLAGHGAVARAGGQGILARELLDEIPRILHR